MTLQMSTAVYIWGTFFTGLYLLLGLIACRCNYTLLTELKVWSLEKILSTRVQVNRMKHAADIIETLNYTCVILRNCSLLVRKIRMNLKNYHCKGMAYNLVDVISFVFSYMCCWSLQVQFLACYLKHFDIGGYDESCRFMSYWELNLMLCRPARHYSACFPSVRTLYNFVSMHLPSRVMASFPHTRPTRSLSPV